MDDELSQEAEELWCTEQRQAVTDYLNREGLTFADVGQWPAWHVAPLIAVWAIESQCRPGWVGWWALSGDLPTDYTTCLAERTPRQALRDIGQKWSDAAKLWAIGKQCESFSLGSSEQEYELAPMLAARATTLLDWASDDDLWEE